MRKKNLLLMAGLLFCLATAAVSCSYENNDNPNEYPDPKPDPEPEPNPEPEVNAEYLAASLLPNCCMVRPGASVDIPILKAYAMWNLYADMLGHTEFAGQMPEPVLIWQDTPGLITNIGLIAGTTAEKASLAVSTSAVVGNALVGIRIGGAIRWSWHIWVTRYNPDAAQAAYGKVYTFDNNGDGMIDYTFMDRNLGAVNTGAVIENTAADSLAACGFLYQWGRKDPFPGDRDFRRSNATDYEYFESKPIYNMDGTQLTESSASGGTGIRSIYTDDDLTRMNLAKSILEPTTVLLGVAGYNDWYCSLEPQEIEQCDTLWCGVKGKTPFDPCPAGWRIPANKNGKFIWNGLDNATTDYSRLGVFPYAGFRYRVGGGCLKNSGFESDVWSGQSPNGNGNALYLEIYIVPYNQKPNIGSDVGCRSDGRSVRCTKEE